MIKSAVKWIFWLGLVGCGPSGWALLALWYGRKYIRILQGHEDAEIAHNRAQSHQRYAADRAASAQAARDWAEGKDKFKAGFAAEWARQEERRAYPNGRPKPKAAHSIE